MNAKLLVGLMMGLGLSAMGCQTMSNEELAEMDLAEYEEGLMDDPTGGGTNNHVLPDNYESNKDKLLSAMGYALGTWTCSQYGCFTSHTLSSNVVNTGILNTAGGVDLFKTAVECALADGQYVTRTVGFITYPYNGNGLMSTTAGWYSGALTTAQKEDVLRCVIARVNASGQAVPIVLTGQNVTNKAGEGHATDLVADALWDVKITTSYSHGVPYQEINEYVWTMSDVGSSTQAPACMDPTTAMQARVCDEDPTCGFEISENAAADCRRYGFTNVRGGPYYYKCAPNNPSGGRPVVQSWVREGLILNLFGQPCDYFLPPAFTIPDFTVYQP